MANFLQVTPFLTFKDVPASVRFFVEVLGFRALVQSWDYAYLEREGVGIRIGKASDGPEERQDFGPRAFVFYIDVRDVDGVAAEVGPKLLAAGLPAGQGPTDQSWGQREFRVLMPEGGLILFGQAIKEAAERG